MDSKTNKVDVIIPFYSNSSWLGEALESVEKQTYPINKIIVVNDGSPEDIEHIQNKYQNVLFLSKTNGGAASARNYGIKASDGDILFFLDSDDLWEKDKIEKQVRFMIDNGLVWSATSYKTFGSTRSKIIVPYRTKKLCWKHIYNSCRIQTSTVAISKDALLGLNEPFAEDMRNGQDVYLWFLLACRYKLGVLTEPLTSFRIRGTNAHLNYVTHIRVRALLWKKISEDKKLRKPNNLLTIFGYKICYSIYEKLNGNIKPSRRNKALFGLAWLSFRIANLFSW